MNNLITGIESVIQSALQEYCTLIISEYPEINSEKLEEIWNNVSSSTQISVVFNTKQSKQTTLPKSIDVDYYDDETKKTCSYKYQKGKNKGTFCGSKPKNSDSNFCSRHQSQSVTSTSTSFQPNIKKSLSTIKPTKKSPVKSPRLKIHIHQNKDIDKFWHKESKLVFKNKEDRIVIGKCIDKNIISLNPDDIEECKKWGFVFDLSSELLSHTKNNDLTDHNHDESKEVNETKVVKSDNETKEIKKKKVIESDDDTEKVTKKIKKVIESDDDSNKVSKKVSNKEKKVIESDDDSKKVSKKKKKVIESDDDSKKVSKKKKKVVESDDDSKKEKKVIESDDDSEELNNKVIKKFNESDSEKEKCVSDSDSSYHQSSEKFKEDIEDTLAKITKQGLSDNDSSEDEDSSNNKMCEDIIKKALGTDSIIKSQTTTKTGNDLGEKFNKIFDTSFFKNSGGYTKEASDDQDFESDDNEYE